MQSNPKKTEQITKKQNLIIAEIPNLKYITEQIFSYFL